MHIPDGFLIGNINLATFAMVSRGYEGEFNRERSTKFKTGDFLFMTSVAAVIISVRFMLA